MSRGLGKVQRMCLDVLRQHDWVVDSITIAAEALSKQAISESEHASFRRALRKLAAHGLVIDMGRCFRDGRRHWATPETAKRYFDKVEITFGKQAAIDARARSSCAPDRLSLPT